MHARGALNTASFFVGPQKGKAEEGADRWPLSVPIGSSQAGLSGSLALGFVIPETPSPEISRGNESHQPYPGI